MTWVPFKYKINVGNGFVTVQGSRINADWAKEGMINWLRQDIKTMIKNGETRRTTNMGYFYYIVEWWPEWT